MIRLKIGLVLFVCAFSWSCLNTNAVFNPVCNPGTSQPDTPNAVYLINLAQPGLAIPPSFLGFSFETSDLINFTGTLNTAINAILVQLLVNLELCGNGAPLTRAGGASTDTAQFSQDPNAPFPPGINFNITPDWIGGIAAVATVIQGQAIVGFNMLQVEGGTFPIIGPPPLGGNPVIPITEVGAFNEFPAGILHAVEGGNRPDLYEEKMVRSPGYSLVSPPAYPFSYLVDYLGITGPMGMQGFLPTVPPFAAPVLSDETWLPLLDTFLTQVEMQGTPGSQLKLVTQQDYSLNICNNKPTTDPTYPTIPLLLSESSSKGEADKYAPFVQVAQNHNLPFRMTEMNSVDCGGLAGVSDTFASALWAIDIMFEMANIGVAGVNFHNKSNTPYNAFDFTQSGTQFTATVNPLYYAAFLFAQATCNQARLVPVQTVTPTTANLKVWATLDEASGIVHVVVLNKDLSQSPVVSIQVPVETTAATSILLTAPSVSSKNGITLGGQTFDGTTDGGPLGTYLPLTQCPSNQSYSFAAPAGSATLLTIRLSPST